MSNINLLDFDRNHLREWFSTLGETTYRADQVIQWIHQKGERDISKMTNLSKSLREKLLMHAEFKLPEVAFTQKSKDGTCKWLLRLEDGNSIETVFIPEKTRGTLCISSQVGCALDCSFCATGKQGFNRNLTIAEIIGQLWLVEHQLLSKNPDKTSVTNVVMMGMGEPLLNFDAVVQAMNLMLDDKAYGLSKYRVTLSTSGLLPQMEKLKQLSAVSLAVSLHAPNNELRNQLVPINKKYPIEDLMQVCQHYFDAEPKRAVTFEYVMIRGVNDTKAHAKQLVNLLKDIPCKLNLIPFNPFALNEYQCSKWSNIEQFQKITRAADINTMVRRERGGDISAACGQLEGDVIDRTTRKIKWLKKRASAQILTEAMA